MAETPVSVNNEPLKPATTIEAGRKLEVPRQKQQQETGKVANNLLYQKEDRAEAELTGKTKEQRKSHLDANPGDNAISSLSYLQKLTDGDKTDRGELGISLDGGNPLKAIVKIDEKDTEVTIRGIKNVQGDTFTCYVQVGEDTSTLKPINISREAVVIAQLLTEEETILDSFSGVEHDLMKAYIISLKGEEIQDADGLNEIIVEAAKSVGILTIADLKSFVEAQANKQAQAATTEAQKAEIELQKNKALMTLEGKNLADYETTLKLIETYGFNPQAQIETLNIQIPRLEEAIKNDPNNLELRTDLEATKLNVRLLQQAQEELKPGGVLSQYFEAAINGQLDPEKSKQLVEAIKTGDMNELIKSLVPDNPNDSPEEIARKKMEREKLIKRMGYGGGLLFLLIYSFAGEMIKSGK